MNGGRATVTPPAEYGAVGEILSLRSGGSPFGKK